jgi:hypothetical protein
MSPRTATLPPTEPAMWRRLLARVHPDTGGDHETFVWAMNLRDVVCSGGAATSPKEEPRPQPPPKKAGESDCVEFDTECDFDELTANALILAKDLPEPYAGVLKLLRGCEEAYDGPLYDQQGKGATYKQLAAIAHTAGMSKDQRIQWYGIAESVPFSRRHAGHVLSRLKGAA